MRSILILRGGALGDFLLTLPLLRALRAAHPSARIELVGNADAARLALPGGLIQTVHSQHDARWAALYRPTPLPSAFDAWLSAFDLVILGWPDPAGEVARHFPRRVGQAALRVDPAPRDSSAWKYWLTAAASVLPAQPDELNGFTPLVLDAEKVRASRATLQLPRPYVAIHPGSGSTAKNAPQALWLDLIARLAPIPVLVVLGEADHSAAPAFQTAASPRVQIAKNWDLSVLAAALAEAAAYAGHDTGVTHLAAAVGTPTYAHFGPTDPHVWAPFGRVVYARRFSVARVTFDPAKLADDLRAELRR
jgi:ADP-heptose:LPS heptosyltransferase